MLCSALGNAGALLLLWLFALAGLYKLRAPTYYQRLMASYCGVPEVGRLLVFSVAMCELTLALLLLLPATRSAGFAAAATVLLFYAVLIGWQYRRAGGNFDCGCAGPGAALRVGPALIARNLVCAGLALLAMRPAPDFPDSLAGAALAMTAAVLMIVAYLYSDQLIASAQAMNEDI